MSRPLLGLILLNEEVRKTFHDLIVLMLFCDTMSSLNNFMFSMGNCGKRFIVAYHLSCSFSFVAAATVVVVFNAAAFGMGGGRGVCVYVLTRRSLRRCIISGTI